MPGAHRVPHRRGDLPRGGHAGLRGRRRVLHARPARRRAAKATPRTVGVVPVHLYGQPVDLAAVQRPRPRARPLDPRGLRARRTAPTGTGDGSAASAARAVFSFYPSKNLTVHGRRRRHRHQRRRGRRPLPAPARSRPARQGRARGGRLQPALQRHPGRHRARAPAAARRDERASAGAGRALRARPGRLPLGLPEERAHARHVYHLYVVRTPRRAELAAFLKERGIQTGIHYPVPTHRQPAVEHFAPPPLPRPSGSWTRSSPCPCRPATPRRRSTRWRARARVLRR